MGAVIFFCMGALLAHPPPCFLPGARPLYNLFYLSKVPRRSFF